MHNYDFRPDMTYPNVVSFARGDVNGDRIPDNVCSCIWSTNIGIFSALTLLGRKGRAEDTLPFTS